MSANPGNRQTSASAAALQFALQGNEEANFTLLNQLENAVYQNLAPRGNRVIGGTFF